MPVMQTIENQQECSTMYAGQLQVGKNRLFSRLGPEQTCQFSAVNGQDSKQSAIDTNRLPKDEQEHD